jgi:hypothetical protein
MVGKHGTVVHFVNVVACQHQDVFGVSRPQDVNILEYRISRAFVPGVFIMPLLGGDQLDILTKFATQKAPTLLDVKN